MNKLRLIYICIVVVPGEPVVGHGEVVVLEQKLLVEQGVQLEHVGPLRFVRVAPRDLRTLQVYYLDRRIDR